MYVYVLVSAYTCVFVCVCNFFKLFRRQATRQLAQLFLLFTIKMFCLYFNALFLLIDYYIYHDDIICFYIFSKFLWAAHRNL